MPDIRKENLVCRTQLYRPNVLFEILGSAEDEDELYTVFVTIGNAGVREAIDSFQDQEDAIKCLTDELIKHSEGW